MGSTESPFPPKGRFQHPASVSGGQRNTASGDF